MWDEMLARNIPRGGVWKDCCTWGEGIYMMLGTYPLTDPSWVLLLKERMILAFKTRPAAEWERMFGSMKVPGAEVKNTCEWMRSEHALASGLVVQRQPRVEEKEEEEEEEEEEENGENLKEETILEAGKLVTRPCSG